MFVGTLVDNAISTEACVSHLPQDCFSFTEIKIYFEENT